MSLRDALLTSKRPILIYGAGVRGCADEARAFFELTGIPLAVTWAVRDLFPEGLIFGTHGTRAGNYAVQNADFILSVGCRLDTKATGTPVSSFAPKAYLAMVDIDRSEIDKLPHFGRKVDMPMPMDAADFFGSWQHQTRIIQWEQWKHQIAAWLAKYPICPQSYYAEPGINPYVLVKELSKHCTADDVIVSDTGNSIAWLMQAFDFKRGQRMLHPWNFTPMGYGLAGAVGAAFATGRRVICVCGDGGLMMSIAELATIAHHNLPIKIFVMVGRSHSMCMLSEAEWMDGRHAGTTVDSGLAFPKDFGVTARGMGLEFVSAVAQSLHLAIVSALGHRGPTFTEVRLPSDARVQPKVKASFPNERAHPLLSDTEHEKNIL